jgi:hypothetical protein
MSHLRRRGGPVGALYFLMIVPVVVCVSCAGDYVAHSCRHVTEATATVASSGECAPTGLPSPVGRGITLPSRLSISWCERPLPGGLGVLSWASALLVCFATPLLGP